jgi:hypothetical protein
MRKGAVAASAALVTMTAMALTATPATAQQVCSAEKAKKRGFGRLMTGLKGSIGGALRGDGDLGSDLAGTAVASARAAGTCLPPDGAEAQRPAADSAAAPVAPPRRKPKAEAIAYPSRMPIPEEWKAAKQAYEEFGKVRCSDCEGGYAYSGWPSWPRDEFDGKYNADQTRLSRLPIGHVHRWSANGFAGTLTVNGEEEHHGFKCRRMTYRLEKDGRNAERPGLMCRGRQNEYAGSENWVGVF